MLQYIEVKPKLKKGSFTTFDKRCYGVTVAASMIYVSCHDGQDCRDSRGDIRVLDIRGNEMRRIGVNKDGSVLYKWPYYVAVSEERKCIYVSGWKEDTITCQTFSGNIIYQYKNADLIKVCGLFVDSKGNVVVCSYDNNCLGVITENGKKFKKILISIDDIQKPMCTDFRRSDGILIVGCEDQNDLHIFKLA